MSECIELHWAVHSIKKVGNKYLEQEGVKDDTVVIDTSDQGYWLGQHRLYDKRLLRKMPGTATIKKSLTTGGVHDDFTWIP